MNRSAMAADPVSSGPLSSGPASSGPGPARHRLPMPAAILVALAGAFLVGMLTSFAQAWTPVVATLANAAGPWFVATALLVLVVRPRLGWALVTGLVAIELMHVGYTVATTLRGYPDSLGPLNTWVVLGYVAGPLAGAVAWAVRSGRPRVRAFAAGIVAAVLVGEGIRALLSVAATTSAGAWIAEISVGVLVTVAGVALTREPVVRIVALATAVVGTAFVIGAYAVLGAVG